MTVLVLADNDGVIVSQPTRSAIRAALELGRVDLLLIGDIDASLLSSARSIFGVDNVIVSNGEWVTGDLAEPITQVILSISKNYKFIVGP